MELKKVRSLYAIPCAFTNLETGDSDGFFFTTFNTKNEEEAFRLASCVCGVEKAKDALVIINEDGDIYFC
jgi:hypothetical protein